MKTVRFLSAVFVLLSLAGVSCAQAKVDEPDQGIAPQLIWKYDTGG